MVANGFPVLDGARVALYLLALALSFWSLGYYVQDWRWARQQQRALPCALAAHQVLREGLRIGKQLLLGVASVIVFGDSYRMLLAGHGVPPLRDATAVLNTGVALLFVVTTAHDLTLRWTLRRHWRQERQP